MKVVELAKMIHQNAVDHGWWDEEQSFAELLALIHSEWSEALEEARADRPMVYKLGVDEDAVSFITPDNPKYAKLFTKPEGIAVELIDGCIRILDVLGREQAEVAAPETGLPAEFDDLMDRFALAKPEELPKDVPTLVTWLHALTSQAYFDAEDGDKTPEVNFIGAMSAVLTWLKLQGIDPLPLLLEKHKYNKGRPYKHGKKF